MWGLVAAPSPLAAPLLGSWCVGRCSGGGGGGRLGGPFLLPFPLVLGPLAGSGALLL